MDYHLELCVLPDNEFTQTDLLNALYAKLHRVLLPLTHGRVGVSFPNYKKTLGNCLRLHGTQRDLQPLMAGEWLQGMRDYIRISPVTPIPDKVRYRTVRRVQSKSAHNKRRRSVAKGWLTEEQALIRIPDTQQQEIKLPYSEMYSLSTGNRMRLYIQHGALVDTAVTGEFNAYGLSHSATIPWF
ncbi:type I-F CRISPR-associated endoribonuclease Cas6/Csy4 [Serratia microhaemolytica]|uniref:type I-F CRISPR-associated endoribonuclease Cas6/Csy4 n=1 Tax=Serratia microhaemolytica TaxID=2675110 RepID=UPI000FDD9FB3|nr:type I-F CRISPR-associated endoribonuclease Cas6/Csy4 [Serratia microhaemolytica]